MLRGLTKDGIAASMHWMGVDRYIGTRRGMDNMPLVLGYHRVVEDFDKSAKNTIAPMLISSRTFEKHLDWIGQHYEFVSLDYLASSLGSRNPGRKPLAAITFDDGYGDVYWNGYPILTRKGIPSAVFVVTDLIGTPRLQIHDGLYLLLDGALSQWPSPEKHLCELFNGLNIYPTVSRRLCKHVSDPFRATRICLEALSRHEINELIHGLEDRVDIPEDVLLEFQSLSWEMLSEMARHDVTIGSHTKSHALLANEPWHRVLDEIKGSRNLLERRLGIKVQHFAYPDGRFDANSVKAVAEAGFRCAYTTCMHRDIKYPLLTIPRRVLWENSCLNSFGQFSPAILSCQVNGIFDPATRCSQEHRL